MTNQGPGWPQDPYAGQQPPGYGPPQGFPPPAQGYPAPDPYAQPAQGYGYEGQPFAPQDWGDYGAGVGKAGLPTWVQVIAYIVSGLKFVPPVAFLIFALFIDSLDENNFRSDTDASQAILIVVALIFLVVGGGLLLAQILGAAKNNRTLLIVIAAILVVLDALAFVSSLADADVAAIILILAVGACQVAVLVGAIQADG